MFPLPSFTNLLTSIENSVSSLFVLVLFFSTGKFLLGLLSLDDSFLDCDSKVLALVDFFTSFCFFPFPFPPSLSRLSACYEADYFSFCLALCADHPRQYSLNIHSPYSQGYISVSYTHLTLPTICSV
eukprot:TRINITY_DN11363_c0_g1_i3.p2 TRINITY_DN11363_c0_g1~~TRINITY_DN11363_c0_g1_i3.p2  ORF type:complete len:127 (-),score=0.73 TRINITY_DN11363_c0_g1_i3:53-433(-)